MPPVHEEWEGEPEHHDYFRLHPDSFNDMDDFLERRDVLRLERKAVELLEGMGSNVKDVAAWLYRNIPSTSASYRFCGNTCPVALALNKFVPIPYHLGGMWFVDVSYFHVTAFERDWVFGMPREQGLMPRVPDPVSAFVTKFDHGLIKGW